MTASELWPNWYWYELSRQSRLADPGFWGSVLIYDSPIAAMSKATYLPPVLRRKK